MAQNQTESSESGAPSLTLIVAGIFLLIALVVAGWLLTGGYRFSPSGTDGQQAETTSPPTATQPPPSPTQASDAGQDHEPTPTPTPVPSPTPLPPEEEPAGLQIGIASLSGDQAITAQLEEALRAALETGDFSQPVTLEPVSLPGSTESIAAVNLSAVAPDSRLLLVWEQGQNDIITIYLLERFGQPPVTRLDQSPTPWQIFTPRTYALWATDDFSFAAELTIGTLEVTEGQIDAAESRLQLLSGILFDMPAQLEDHNQPALDFALGRAEIARGDLTGALRTISAITRQYPAFDAALLTRGTLYLSLGDGSAALNSFEELSAPSPELYYNRALAHLRLDNSEAALADAEQLVVATSQSAFAVNFRGIIYYELELYDEALADFELASELAPRNPVPVLNQALSLNQMDEYGQALLVFDALIEQQPDNPTFHYFFGVAFEAAGEPEQAQREYTEAIDLNPDYLEAYIRRGRLYVEAGAYEEAESDARRALELAPDSAQAQWILGDALLALEDFPAAQEAYTTALDLGLIEPAIYAGRGYALHRQRFLRGAIDDYEQALTLDYSEPLMLKRLGFALYDNGRFDDALDMFSAAVDGGLETAESLAGLSIALDANLRREDAQVQYDKALAINQDYGYVSFLREQPLWSEQAVIRAVTILRRLDIDPYTEQDTSEDDS